MTKEEACQMLGSPPWTDEFLLSCASSYIPIEVCIAENHPGGQIYEEFESIRLSLNIFLNSVSDLITWIDVFKGAFARRDFWERPGLPARERLEMDVQRGILYSTLSAMVLVDVCRNMSKKYAIPGYSKAINGSFAKNPQHKFIQDFRNYITHFKITKADWASETSEKGRSIFFIIDQSRLMEWDGWTSQARIYIQGQPGGINIEELFMSYSQKVADFHGWFRSAVFEEYGNAIADYLKSIKIARKRNIYSQWSFLIREAINRKVNPYVHLDRHLTKRELGEISALPHRSINQVDHIIAIIDEDDVCDHNLRQLVYQLFNVNLTDNTNV